MLTAAVYQPTGRPVKPGPAHAGLPRLARRSEARYVRLAHDYEVIVMKPSSQPILQLGRLRTRCALTLGALAVAVLGVSPAAATTLNALDLRPRCRTLRTACSLGTVEKVVSHYLGEGSTYIVTDVTIRCERELLGVPAGSRFVVRHLGGTVGELGQRVHGEASYRPVSRCCSSPASGPAPTTPSAWRRARCTSIATRAASRPGCAAWRR